MARRGSNKNKPAARRYLSQNRGYKRHVERIKSEFEKLNAKNPGMYKLVSRSIKDRSAARQGQTKVVYQIIRTDREYIDSKNGEKIRKDKPKQDSKNSFTMQDAINYKKKKRMYRNRNNYRNQIGLPRTELNKK